MSDEHPAGESRDPHRETPAPEAEAFDAGGAARQRPAEAAADAPGPVREGIMAALKLFAAAVGVELLALGCVRLSANPNANVIGAFLFAGLLIAVVGLTAAIVITGQLSPAARVPFWAMGIVCVFATMILWGVTCGLAGTPRFN